MDRDAGPLPLGVRPPAQLTVVLRCEGRLDLSRYEGRSGGSSNRETLGIWVLFLRVGLEGLRPVEGGRRCFLVAGGSKNGPKQPRKFCLQVCCSE